MNPSFPALHDVRRDELGKVLEPEARCLHLAMTELPRLDDLVGFPDLGADDRDRILDSHHRRMTAHQVAHKLQRPFLPSISYLGCEVTGSGDRQISAGRMGYDQIPELAVIVVSVAHAVALNVIGAVILAGE